MYLDGSDKNVDVFVAKKNCSQLLPLPRPQLMQLSLLSENVSNYWGHNRPVNYR